MIFSVIVPVCNGETYIEECIRSAVEQQRDFGDEKDIFEVIICENGSSDSTPVICDRLAGEYGCVKALHRGRIGLFRARQEGIRAASGDWIVALDGDDEMAPGALKALYDELQAIKDDVDIILYNAAVLGQPGRKLREFPFKPGIVYAGEDKRIFMEQLCRDDSVNAMWIKCIRRSIAAFDNIDLFLNYGEDLYQTAEYLDRAKGVLYLDRVLYYYRKDSVSLSSTYSEIYLEDEKNTWQQLDKFSKKWFGDEFTQTISERKALTCTIAVSKLVYSDLSMADKKYKLDKLLQDPFYKEYSQYPLPEWAPEEARFVNGLQRAADCRRALLFNSFKHGIKRKIKGRLRNGR